VITYHKLSTINLEGQENKLLRSEFSTENLPGKVWKTTTSINRKIWCPKRY